MSTSDHGFSTRAIHAGQEPDVRTGAVVPPIYQFRVRSRVFRWYAQLRDIENKVDANRDDVRREALVKELDDLDRVVTKVAVPLSYADELRPIE